MSRGHGRMPYGDISTTAQREAIGDGCAEANKIFETIMFDSYWKRAIYYLDDHDIRGEELVRFYRNCCNENDKVLMVTLRLLNESDKYSHHLYSEEELECNMGLKNPVPFYDNELKIDSINPLTNLHKVGFKEEHWNTICSESHKRFIDSLKEAVKEQYLNFSSDNSSSSIEEMIDTTNLVFHISQGVPESVEAILEIMTNCGGKETALHLDHLGICGDKLRKLYIDCCGGNKQSLYIVANMINQGLYSDEKVLKNLSLDTPIPFLDENISYDGDWYWLEEKQKREYYASCVDSFNRRFEIIDCSKNEQKSVDNIDKSILDSIIERLSAGDPQVRDILLKFSTDYNFIDGAIYFDKYGIKGELLLKLMHSCNNDMKTLNWVIDLFINNRFPVEAILANLALPEPIPFINMDIVQSGDRFWRFDKEAKARLKENTEYFLKSLKNQSVNLQKTSKQEERKLDPSILSPIDLIAVLSAGDSNTYLLVSKLISKESRPALNYCYDLDIKGEKFSKFYLDGCCGYMNKFYLTLEMFKQGIYSEEMIQMNLALPKPVSFIRESSDIMSVPVPFGKNAYSHPLWKQYFKGWKDDFLKEFGERLTLVVSDGIGAAVPIVIPMLRSHTRDGLEDLMFCVTNDIVGNRLVNLYNACCDRDQEKFEKTLDHLKTGVHPATVIKNNLDLEHPIPFLNDNFQEEYHAAMDHSNESTFHH